MGWYDGHIWGGMWGPGMWGTGTWSTGWGVALAILGIISILGGIYSLRRTTWGLVLTGAITTLFPPMAIVLGILAIIFVSLSKREFS